MVGKVPEEVLPAPSLPTATNTALITVTMQREKKFGCPCHVRLAFFHTALTSFWDQVAVPNKEVPKNSHYRSLRGEVGM